MARQTAIYAYLASWVERQLQGNPVLASYLSVFGFGSLFPYVFNIGNMELEIAWLSLFN